MLKKYLINININYHHSTINVSNGTKSGERQYRSLAKMIFWRVLLPIIISRYGVVFEVKYFTPAASYILC